MTLSQNDLLAFIGYLRFQIAIRWDDVTNVTKEKMALVFPNAIQVNPFGMRVDCTKIA